MMSQIFNESKQQPALQPGLQTEKKPDLPSFWHPAMSFDTQVKGERSKLQRPTISMLKKQDRTQVSQQQAELSPIPQIHFQTEPDEQELRSTTLMITPFTVNERREPPKPPHQVRLISGFQGKVNKQLAPENVVTDQFQQPVSDMINCEDNLFIANDDGGESVREFSFASALQQPKIQTKKVLPRQSLPNFQKQMQSQEEAKQHYSMTPDHMKTDASFNKNFNQFSSSPTNNRIQPISQKTRPASHIKAGRLSETPTAASNHMLFSFCETQPSEKATPDRIMSSKLRPTSSMNQLIRRKLPDCFLLDYSSPTLNKPTPVLNKIQSAQVRQQTPVLAQPSHFQNQAQDLTFSASKARAIKPPLKPPQK